MHDSINSFWLHQSEKMPTLTYCTYVLPCMPNDLNKYIHGLYRSLFPVTISRCFYSQFSFWHCAKITYEGYTVTKYWRLIHSLSHHKWIGSRVWLEVSWDHFFSAISACLFCPASECDCCVHISPNEAIIQEKHQPGVNTPGVSLLVGWIISL